MMAPCRCEKHLPRAVSNPPGLDEIAYRVDTFAGFRQALLHALPGETALVGWAPAPGDLGLQMLEWWAYLGDILTFYNERIANESYLRTVRDPSNLAGLVGLLGFRPRPGIAATGQVAALRTASHPNETMLVPATMPLASTSTPGVAAQTFEVTRTHSFAGLAQFPVTLAPSTTLATNPSGGPASVLLAGKVAGVKGGDRVLLVENGWSGSNDNWSWTTVASVAPAVDPATGKANTLVTFVASAGWGPIPPPPEGSGGTLTAGEHAREVLLAETSIGSGLGGIWWHPRGPVGPAATTDLVATNYRLLRATQTTSLWNHPGGTTGEVPVDTSSSPVQVHLTSSSRAIGPGDMVLLDGEATYASSMAVVSASTEELWTVAYPGPTPPTPPTIVIAHTALSLATVDADTLAGYSDLAKVSVRFGFRDVGTVIGVPTPTLTAIPAPVGVPDSFSMPGAATTAFLQDATGAGALVSVVPGGSGQIVVEPVGGDEQVLYPALAAPMRILVDLVPVSRGATVASETLGSGDATLINQSFTLLKGPLTYLAQGDSVASTLTVFVDGAAWTEVATFYGQGSTARVFVVSRSPDGTATVTFGDGVNGARLTTGAGNVVATYRYGSGAASPPAGRLTTILKPQPNLGSIENPVAVSGGADPQSPADVRRDAPASVFTFGRAISALDYQVVAAQASGVDRAVAYWDFDPVSQRALVTVYVGDDLDALAAARAALAGAEDPNRPVSVLLASPVPLDVSGTVVVAADRQAAAVLAAATAAIADPTSGLFSPGSMPIGGRLYRSRIDAALMVPGVVALRGHLAGHGLEVTSAAASPVQVLDEVLSPPVGGFFTLGALSLTPTTVATS